MSHKINATYRVQLRPNFGFASATQILSYIKELGVSHLYTSPYLQAAQGSLHGYDVVDPRKVNEELGGDEAHKNMCETLQKMEMGHMIDIVPNHMAISKNNPWWWDVLENGPSSPFATYFDVDWDSSEVRWPNKVLMPILGDHYGRILEQGQLKLKHQDGVFTLHYYEHIFPIDPSSLPELLNAAADNIQSETLSFLAQSYARLPRPTVTARDLVRRRHRDKEVLANLLNRLCKEELNICNAIDNEVERLNDELDELDWLIDMQNYRLAYWKTASRELGYRRFFNIQDLAGLRIEDIEVFKATHNLPISWVNKGWVQGLRIDHPDGLRNPANYFKRLRNECPEAWIVCEKILEPGEKLRQDWPIDGTTGYEFLNLMGGLFINPAGKEDLTRIYHNIIEHDIDLSDLVKSSKRFILTQLLESELNRLTNLFIDICERHRRHRDYTRYELHEALCETAVCFPVYRTYITSEDKYVSEEDEKYVTQAIEEAKSEREDLDSELFGFLKNLLLLKIPGNLEGEMIMRFQQLTGAAMAKGVEDTALYRYQRLIGLNEVGGDLHGFGFSLPQFHNQCEQNQLERPLSLLCSTTHDTKRSEDVRARLAVLSEISNRWEEVVRDWFEHNKRHHIGQFPDSNTEYLFYQTIVGAWPINSMRMLAYMEKAIREAKVHTSWNNQQPEYEKSIRDFVTTVMEDEVFLQKLQAFVDEITPSGRINSLAQTLIKLTAPGVPDIYQGTELWDFSLVDPDNRRDVDFYKRHNFLQELKELDVKQIVRRMDDGLPKMWIIKKALELRNENPDTFGPDGQYGPVYAQGSKSHHVVCFIRGENVAVVVPRLVMGFDGDWGDTYLEIPKGKWKNILTGEVVEGPMVNVKDILDDFPVGLMVKE